MRARIISESKMVILPVDPEILKYVRAHGLEKKFLKQVGLFSQDPYHPSLKFELLEPRHLRIYSFRIDRKYRAIFIFRDRDTIEIIDANNHYQ